MMRKLLLILTMSHLMHVAFSQKLPNILSDKATIKEHYLPDFSFAGYHYSEKAISHDCIDCTVINVTDFGVKPNDGLDDSRALMAAMKTAHDTAGKVLVILPAGQIILSEIIYIERSDLILRGAGSGEEGTVIYCPRPMNYLQDPSALAELREYLIALDKRQKEPQNNIDLPFSQYAWAGGMIWTRKPGVRTKAYLDQYDEDPIMLTMLLAGKQGEREMTVAQTNQIKVGQVVQLEWFNKEGKEGSFIQSIYGEVKFKVGSHHWEYPTHALVKQPTVITAINGNKVTIKDPLLHDVKAAWSSQMVAWDYLTEVGIEHIRIEFPMAPNIAHHVEDGYNGIYLTRLYNGWIQDVKIKNADSGILTEEVANVTIRNIETFGDKLAHYSVAMSGVHNVLVERLQVRNEVRHPLSFNTFSTKSVYRNCVVEINPILDQHSGVNHQNLFDQITVKIPLKGKDSYPLFAGGGAGYWKPSHGAFTTFWNINVEFQDGFDQTSLVVLNGMTDGPKARLVGIHANHPINIEYGPDAYSEAINKPLIDVPSLFQYQLNKRTFRP